MRVLHFCNYADLVGGAEVYAHALVRALRARGHEVALFGASPSREVDEPGLRVIRRPLHDADLLVRDPAAVNALCEYLRRFRPEVVHAHNLFSVSLEVLHQLWTGPAPVLHTVHDFQVLCPNSWCVRGDGTPCPGGAGAQCFQHGCQKNYPYDAWSVLLTALRQQLIARGTAISLSPSAYLADRLRANGWGEVRHQPYFIDFEPQLPAPARSDHDLLYVGRLEREKGVGILLSAMPEILASSPRTILTVVGSGSQERELRRTARRLGVGASVRFQSQVPREQLARHYALAALCILPSLWTENSPLVAHECLRAGLPMVGSRAGGIPELIEPDCGFVFAAGDPHDLASAVLRYLRLPASERKAISSSAVRRSHDFAKDRHLEAIEAVYAELATRAAPPPAAALTPELLAILQVVGDDRRARTARGLRMARRLARAMHLPKFLDG